MFGHSTTTTTAATGKATDVTEPTRRTSTGKVTKLVLSSCTALYSASNLVLFILSAVSFHQARHAGKRWFNCLENIEMCNPSRWNLHAFIMMASLIAAVTSGILAVRCLRHRRVTPLDSVTVFRTIFFTLILFVPLMFIGWSPESAVMQPSAISAWMARQSYDKDNNTNSTEQGMFGGFGSEGSMPAIDFGPGLSYGLGGAFIIESFISGFRVIKATIFLFHANM